MGIELRFFVGFSEKVELLLEYGIVREKIVYVFNNVNLGKVICFRLGEEIFRMLIFLSCYDVVGIIVKRFSILNYDLDI